MAKKSTKPAVTPQPAAHSETPTPLQEAPSAPNIDKAVQEALGEIAKVQAKRAALTGLLAVVEKQKAKLREAEAEYQAAATAVDQLQAELVAKYPNAAVILGTGKASKVGGTRKGSKAKGAKKGGNTLNLEQANQVLAAMPTEFDLGGFGKKARELFPQLVCQGAMKLLKDKVKKLGGKGKGIRYRKA